MGTARFRTGGVLFAAVLVGSCAAPPAEETSTVDAGTGAGRVAAAAPSEGAATEARREAPVAAPSAAVPTPPPAAPAPAAPPAAEREHASVPRVDEGFRPEWWIEEPVTHNGTYTVGASADAATVRDSRRGAVVTGESLASGAGGIIAADPEVHAVRTVRLPSGYYRTFVLMSWPLPEPDA